MTLPSWKKIWEWFASGLAGDIRSIIVSSITTSAVIAGWSYLTTVEPSHLSIFTNDNGYAQPLEAILAESTAHKDTIRFTFAPDALRSVYVCEFAQVEGTTPSQMMLSYIAKYSTCFNISQTDESSYKIWRNSVSGELVERNGQFLCRCGA
jgi:hypothetical protein